MRISKILFLHKTNMANLPLLMVWPGIFFSLTAAFMSDFAVPWGTSELVYEIATIAGLIASALLMSRYREKAWMFAFGGAVLSILTLLYMELTAISPIPFVVLRLGLAPLLAYAVWQAFTLVARHHSYLPYTLCTLAGYATLAFLQCFQFIAQYFSALCIIFCFFAALSLLLCPNQGCQQGAAPQLEPRRAARLALAGRKLFCSKGTAAMLLLLFMLNQLFNSLDVFIFSQFSNSTNIDELGLAYPISILLIGIGYFLGGILADKKGVPAVFVVSCALIQVFLLVSLLPENNKLLIEILPLYVLSSAGADLCLILLPMVYAVAPSPIRAVSGVLLFRFLKLYFIPSIFPKGWQLFTHHRVLFVLTILLALVQMLVVIYGMVSKRGSWPARNRKKAVVVPPPPLPPGITPREEEVMKLLLAGKDRSEIADGMGISFSTVNKHCVSIYRKTGCSSHLELLNRYGRLYSEGTQCPINADNVV